MAKFPQEEGALIVDTRMGKILINVAQKELSQVLGKVNEPDSKPKQFKGLVKTYLHINGIKPFCQPKNYSQFSDELVADEIEERSALDGRLFRKEGVKITDSARVAQSEEKIEGGLIEQKIAPHFPSKSLIQWIKR